jgi:glutathione S-transferase
MDSAEIVRRLDHLQPTPGLRLESDLISRVDTVFDRIYAVADRLYLYGVPALLLSEPSTSHFLEDRKKMLGIDVESYAAQKSGDDIYDGVVPYIRTLGTILRENSSGPFCLGDEASYADIIIVSWMKFWLRLGVLERMIQSDPFPLSTLLTVFAQFLARDHL